MSPGKRLADAISRRKLLKLSPLVLLAGCDATPKGATESFLRSVQKFNDWVQAKVFNQAKPVPECSEAELTPEDGFRVNGKDAEDPDIDLDTWMLQVDGLVSRPGSYAMAAIVDLPKRVMNTRHVCVEGWSMVPKWGGAVLKDFLSFSLKDRAQFVS